ncbi:MAG: hypothetical protein ACK502_06840 [Alphaproteobacteria bacterium]
MTDNTVRKHSNPNATILVNTRKKQDKSPTVNTMGKQLKWWASSKG